MPPTPATARFATALAELDAELDWPLLGRLHCHEGGESFYPPDQRQATQDTGLRFAADVGEALAALPPGGPGRSLYLGASVAELAPILFEHLVLRREVLLRRLPGPESAELARAFDAVADRLGEPLPAIDTDDAAPIASGAFDHGWVVSVLTDPECFPALHDELYGRRGTELAAGGGDLARERRAAEKLVDGVLEGLAPRALLTTTDEELPLFDAAARRRGRRLAVPGQARLSGVVGDPVRHCLL